MTIPLLLLCVQPNTGGVRSRELFLSALKSELVHERDYHPRDHGAEVFEFIEVFYNRQRLHQTSSYVSPVKFEPV